MDEVKQAQVATFHVSIDNKCGYVIFGNGRKSKPLQTKVEALACVELAFLGGILHEHETILLKQEITNSSLSDIGLKEFLEILDGLDKKVA